MGITIVHKSGSAPQRMTPTTALVLASGAISGGAFKLGGMLALERFLGGGAINTFDIYVGISAGGFLAAPLAAGTPLIELYRAVSSRSRSITPFKPSHFYWPNFEEFLVKPWQWLRDTILYAPVIARDLLHAAALRRGTVLDDVRRALAGEQDARLVDAIVPVLAEVFGRRPFPISLHYLPSGIFDNSRIERYMRSNFEANGFPNRFRLLQAERGARLYICATNLQTAQMDVFGPDEDNSATISEAIQASTAIPGFFRPARIGGRDYVDGGIARTAHLALAARKGADLIIAYNPFRPYTADVLNTDIVPGQTSEESSKLLADEGLVSVLNQAIRALLHTRLHIGLEKLRLDPGFNGDIILVEPKASDREFFHMNPLNFWGRKHAMEMGYRSVKESLESQFPLLQRILRHHGIEPNLEALQATLEHITGLEADRELIEAFEHEAKVTSPRARLKVVS